MRPGVPGASYWIIRMSRVSYMKGVPGMSACERVLSTSNGRGAVGLRGSYLKKCQSLGVPGDAGPSCWAV